MPIEYEPSPDRFRGTGTVFIAWEPEDHDYFGYWDYHTYTVTAPDPFVAPFFTMLLERTPKPQPEEPRSWRKDEYPF